MDVPMAVGLRLSFRLEPWGSLFSYKTPNHHAQIGEVRFERCVKQCQDARSAKRSGSDV